MRPPGWRRWFRRSWDPAVRAADVDREFAFHLAMRAEQLRQAGVSPGTAAAGAEDRFGNRDDLRAACLIEARNAVAEERRTFQWLDLAVDARYGLRGLRRHPVLTAVLVLVLAIGVGAATATYALVDALLLRPLAIPHPTELVVIGDPTRTHSVTTGGPRVDLASYPLYTDMRHAVPQVRDVAASGRLVRIDVVVPGARRDGTPSIEHPAGRFVSGNYFAVMGVGAQVGRTFLASEDHAPGDDPVAVISDRYWRQRFGADPAVVGRTLTVNGTPLIIVGVAARGFDGEVVEQPTAIWVPLMMEPAVMPSQPWLADRSTSWLLMLARLQPGATLAQARTAFNTAMHASIHDHATPAEYAAEAAHAPVPVSPAGRGVSTARAVYTGPITILMAAVLVLLLLTAANAANVSLARVVAGAADTSVRAALGASRFRLVRQCLVEHLLIGAVAGAAGLALAGVGGNALLRLADPAGDTLRLNVDLTGRVVVFGLSILLVAVFLFGLFPTLWQLRSDPATVLRGHGRGMVRGWDRRARGLVVTQVALSVVLVAVTAMLQQNLARMQAIDVGVARDQLVGATIDLARGGYGSAQRFAALGRLIERATAVPRVQGASYTVNGIFGTGESDTTMQVEGFTPHTAADTLVKCDFVGPAFFTTLGARLISGRDLSSSDDANAPRVIVVNAGFARFFFGTASAVGRHVTLGATAFEIVGVVPDIRQQEGVRVAPSRRAYFAAAQFALAPAGVTLVVRTSGTADRLLDPLRNTLTGADAALEVVNVTPFNGLMARSLAQDRLLADVVTFFGLIALILAGLGVYGVMAHSTARRTREFGVRLALGAAPDRLATKILGEGLLLVLRGVGIGVVLAIAAVPLLRHQQVGTSGVDPRALAEAAIVLLAVAGAASAIPAIRAARLAPVEALRRD